MSATTAKAWKRWIPKLLLVLGSVCVTLLAIEIAVVVFWDEPTGEFVGDEVYPDNPRGYFTAGSDGRYLLRTDRGEHRCNAPPTDDDIVFVGDSFTWGQGVRVEDTLSSLVADSALPVRNCGRSGNDFEAIAESIQSAAEQKARLVVYGLVLNDACGVQGPDRINHFQIDNDLPGTNRNGIVDDGMWVRTGTRQTYLDRRREELGSSKWLLSSVAFRWLHRRVVLAEVADHTEAVYQRCWEDSALLQSTFDRLAEVASTTRGFVVLIWPMFVELGDYPFADAHATIKAGLTRRGITVVDLLDTFEGADTDALIVHRLDRHPNEVAHKMALKPVMDVINRALKR